jgi:2,3-bisphosphoglycerate-dependent phosphoglycerate mutase
MLKKIFILALFVLLGAATQSFAQTTVILVRHAEKAAVTGAMSATDPELSEAGVKRAESLVAALKEYKPDLFYSTPYIRTKKTITPLATKYNGNIEVYNASKLDEFAATLKRFYGKTIVVAGHSNTTPALVNQLLGENKYPALDDSVYNKIWIVTIDKEGKVTDKLIEY